MCLAHVPLVSHRIPWRQRRFCFFCFFFFFFFCLFFSPFFSRSNRRQRTNFEVMTALEMSTYRNVYGAHFPAILRAQDEVLRGVGRGPGLPSSGVAVEVLRGQDEDLDWSDVLGDESGRGDVDMHLAMERKLGIQIRSDF